MIHLLKILLPILSVYWADVSQAQKSLEQLPLPVTSFLKERKLASLLEQTEGEGLKLRKVQSSLLAKHYYFSQQWDLTPVEGGGIVVSQPYEKSQKIRLFDHRVSGTPEEKTAFLFSSEIDRDEAYDIAWNFLKVHGHLTGTPSIVKIFFNQNKLLRKVYRVILPVSKPAGQWAVIIDIYSGEIILHYDTRISRKTRSFLNVQEYQGPLTNRILEFRALKQKGKHLKTAKKVRDQEQVNIPAFVFDPDPRSSLDNEELEDDSDAELFEGAYVERVLRDISFDGKHYQLKGPWVQIVDIEEPNTPPHHSKDPSWFFKRGQNQFNEAMSYYHIDHSQRYIQSLGFIGETSILEKSIEVDADGADGEDNSFYLPGTKQLSFGHGCVDDNEDADVILHEYGHAIQDAIDDNWLGGDTGAIGEGFGDYWAASYSLSTAEGSQYKPNEIYSWDGHGSNNSCWSGRILNADGVRYDHATDYTAHQELEGGYISDELWSTPLFQAHIELLDLGVPRTEIDTVVLESHFGLSGAVTMPDLAKSTVQAALGLYPDGPHADIFEKHFLHHTILTSTDHEKVQGKPLESNR